MDWKLELISIPVSDVDRAKAFYTDQVGFHADHDHRVNDDLRFVQITPPGSACSIAFGTGISTQEPGSYQGLQIVVSDVTAPTTSWPAVGSRSRTSRTCRGGGSCSSAIRTATAGRSRSSGPADPPAGQPSPAFSAEIRRHDASIRAGSIRPAPTAASTMSIVLATIPRS